MTEVYQPTPEVRSFLDRQHRLLIGGKWVEASSEKRFEVINPANKQLLTTVAEGGRDDVNRAVQAARQAFDSGSWSEMAAAQRTKILWRWADLIEQNAEQLIALEVLDNGMPITLARGFFDYGVGWIRYYAGMTDKIMGKNLSDALSSSDTQYHAYTQIKPIGVAALILPWNGPIGLFLIKTSPALAAGCACVVKPAENTPLTALRMAELALEAGVPEGVLNVVTGFGEAGEALAQHPAVDKISFTGSTSVGKTIICAASANLKRVTLELGGKSPCIIFDDANLDEAIPAAAMAIFLNSGQVCFAGSRLYVQRKIYDRVVAGIADFSQTLKVGDGMHPDTMLGPLISEQQLHRVNQLVDSGRRQGAQILTAKMALSNEGFFFAPTIFANVDANMSIVKEEIFGPVLVATPFDTTEEVLALANDTQYGLGAGIFSNNINRVHRVAEKLQAGNVWVNHYGGMQSCMPFGGFKQSGWGRELGEDGFLAFTEQKSVSIQLRGN
ncbi:MAG: aldehyde dehydrogenase family protein [Porticoccaceae bacterium]|nr:aldehyde dehydrogenase family protein [Porticoccaceae bacterium]